MHIVENPVADSIPAPLLEKLHEVSFPTLGHFHERGFLDPAVHSHLPGAKIAGKAVTVQIPGIDSSLMHRAVALLEPGDVLVVATGGDRGHAPVGEVVAHAAKVVGASAIVIDGVMTDVREVARIGLPVFAYGTSLMTTKLLGLPHGAVNVPVSVGGVVISPGDVVLGDDNGLLAIPVADVERLIDHALESDAAEHRLIEQLDAGVPLPDVTVANKVLAEALRG
ncbi:RraA family protein [Streptomyces aureus]|uniref:Putative 4-hydroxy-4-methyl-2-oxoglutarate aldolase n=1 Tax=Streptomyces aureus TaxID=193461 RepID=A0ABV4T203_9ACTN